MNKTPGIAASPALDTEGLPPLPEPDVIAYTCIGDNDAYSPMLVKQIVAPYAERIRQLERGLKQVKLQELSDIGQDIERELATFKGEHATQLATKSIGEDRQFHRLLVDFGAARFQDVQTTRERLIAYIDGRTASLLAEIHSLASQGMSHGLLADDFCSRIFAKIESWDGRTAGAAPEGYIFVPEVPTEAMIVAIERKVDEQLVASGIYPADMCRQDGADIYEAMIAAAPSDLNSGKEEA